MGLLARWHFAPTPLAAARLRAEGKPENRIYVTGNTVVDALRCTLDPDYRSPHLTWADGRALLLLTLHRRESWGAPMEALLTAIREEISARQGICLLYPLHPNPAIGATARRIFAGCPNVLLTEPLGTRDFHNLEARAALCLTDSGGVQEECTALGRTALVLRNATERPEGISAGYLRLVGTEPANLRRELRQELDMLSRTAPPPVSLPFLPREDCPYGDGFAARRAVQILKKELWLS